MQHNNNDNDNEECNWHKVAYAPTLGVGESLPAVGESPVGH